MKSKLSEEDIAKKVCEIMGIKYSHYDNHKMDLDYFRPHTLTSIPKIVVYGSKYGPWEFAILEDMTIHTVFKPFNETLLQAAKVLESKSQIPNEEISEQTKRIQKEMSSILEAEKFLLENNCAEVINNPKKKINWV